MDMDTKSATIECIATVLVCQPGWISCHNHRRQLHGGDHPHSQKVVGVTPSSRSHRNFVMSSFETVKCTLKIRIYHLCQWQKLRRFQREYVPKALQRSPRPSQIQEQGQGQGMEEGEKTGDRQLREGAEEGGKGRRDRREWEENGSRCKMCHRNPWGTKTGKLGQSLNWSLDSQENNYNCCNQISYFKAKMHQIRFQLGLRPRPRQGAHSAPPDSLAGFKGS